VQGGLLSAGNERGGGISFLEKALPKFSEKSQAKIDMFLDRILANFFRSKEMQLMQDPIFNSTLFF